MGLFDFLFGKTPSSDASPKGCCGGGCCGHENQDMPQALQLTDEDVLALKASDGLIVVGKVLEVSAHPDPAVTKVRVTQTDVGGGQVEQILCGGENLAAGQIVPVAKVGAKLSGDFQIGVREIRGAVSNGMICARKELGLSLAGEGDRNIWPLDASLEKFLGKSLKELF